jgi:hypothetical protein
VPRAACCAGEWRGLAVAIKAVLFQSSGADDATALVASEAAIATNLVHRSLVATYSHDVRSVTGMLDNELSTYKFYLVQVRSSATGRHAPAPW